MPVITVPAAGAAPSTTPASDQAAAAAPAVPTEPENTRGIKALAGVLKPVAKKATKDVTGSGDKEEEEDYGESDDDDVISDDRRGKNKKTC